MWKNCLKISFPFFSHLQRSSFPSESSFFFFCDAISIPFLSICAFRCLLFVLAVTVRSGRAEIINTLNCLIFVSRVRRPKVEKRRFFFRGMIFGSLFGSTHENVLMFANHRHGMRLTLASSFLCSFLICRIENGI